MVVPGHCRYATTASTIGAQFQDVNRINYYTPRFAGLQVGVSYAPKINLASSAAGASESQQIAVAQRVLSGQGIGAWPVCGANG